MLLSNSSSMDGVIQFITVLLIFVIVLAVTYFVTRWLGNYQKMQNSGNNIQVVESVRISPSAYVEILRIGKKYVAVAVTKDSVSFITELAEDDLVIRDDGSINPLSFGSILEKVKLGQNSTDSDYGKQEDE